MTAVGVVGASGRAAAASLLRASYSPWAVDLFADRDLKRIAPTARCPADRYPAALPGLTDAMPPGPVLYTGGLENHPGVVRELAARRELWGNPPEVLERVRDPFRLAATLAAAGFAVPRVLPSGPAPPGRWLRKPLRSAGGHGIRFATPDDHPDPAFYLQEYIQGRPMSAVFIGGSLFGVTEQLVGESWLHARPFGYAGSIGPVPTPEGVRRLGDILSRSAGLTGIWGCDLILAGDIIYPIEVNPRYTASVEVLEHGIGAAAMKNPSPGPSPKRGGEQESGRGPSPPSLLGKGAGGLGCVGKAIYFSPRRIAFPPAGPWDTDLTGDFDPWRLPSFADIPEPGEVIEPGWPVLSVFGTGPTVADCRAALQAKSAELERLFG
jgi:predicted ATP-grasp superfamily ATP-dependent carboligase